MRTARLTKALCLAFASSFLLMTNALGDTAGWTNWTNYNGHNPGTVTGTMTFGSQTVNVTYTGEVSFAQLNNAGPNYYSPATTFSNSTATGPSKSDMIAIDGTTAAHTVTFSSPITDPLMAIVSLGQPGLALSYNFSADFNILSQGPSTAWGTCSTPPCLTGGGTSTLSGREADGILEFPGTFTSLSWTVTNSEYWNGFTFGALGVGTSTSGVPEPAAGSLIALALSGFALLSVRKRFRS